MNTGERPVEGASARASFDPGEGWREAPLDSHVFGKRHIYEFDEDANAVRKWVRVDPVPPLPTEPYTVIRVTWKRANEPVRDAVFDLRDGKAGPRWWNEQGPHEAEWLLGVITGFEVLSEPRAVTAKAVLDAIRAEGLYQIAVMANPKNAEPFDAIAREFGVSA